MTRGHRHRGNFPINPPYPPPGSPPGYTATEPDPDATVPVSELTPEQEAIVRLHDADETTKKMFDHPLGKIFLAVCAVFAILIVASLGICVLSKIWLEIFT
jgi:hypothetical protein